MNMSANSKHELALLDQYNTELEGLTERLANSDSQSSKAIQKQIEQKLQIYWKQISLVKSQFPDEEEGKVHEAAFYTFQASTKLYSSGLLRRMSDRTAGTTAKLATGLIAKQQEKNNAQEAIRLLDTALNIFDYPGARLAKAGIFHGLNQNQNALTELNYIIASFQAGKIYYDEQKTYLAARQLKDEIENPPKKGMCFVATAAYGSPLAPEVVLLSRFRDEVLLSSKWGTLFVNLYYFTSPPLARLIAKAQFLRTVTRVLLLKPILRLLKHTSHF
jgi:hypothetical protein